MGYKIGGGELLENVNFKPRTRWRGHIKMNIREIKCEVGK
jgi:hypothetical protein